MCPGTDPEVVRSESGSGWWIWVLDLGGGSGCWIWVVDLGGGSGWLIWVVDLGTDPGRGGLGDCFGGRSMIVVKRSTLHLVSTTDLLEFLRIELTRAYQGFGSPSRLYPPQPGPHEANTGV